MKFIAVFSLLAAIAAASKLSPQLRAQLTEGGPIILDHGSDYPGAPSSVAVQCKGDGMTLILTQGASSPNTLDKVSFKIGTGSDAACGKDVAPYDSANPPSIEVLGDICEREENGALYTWKVEVLETISVDADRELSFRAPFDVVCKQDGTNVNSVNDVAVPDVPSPQGTATAPLKVEFSLTKLDTVGRVWQFLLEPKDASELRGLKYRIVNLVASTPAGNAVQKSVNLIDNGCVRDTGVTVAPGSDATSQQTTIGVKAFQFKGSSGAVDFSVTTALCAAAEDCTRTKPESECQTPRNGNRIKSSRSTRSAAPEFDFLLGKLTVALA